MTKPSGRLIAVFRSNGKTAKVCTAPAIRPIMDATSINPVRFANGQPEQGDLHLMKPHQPIVNRGAQMLRQSDVQAERIIARLRMVLSAALFFGVLGLLVNMESAGLGIRQFELAFLLVGAGAYFLMGAVNFYFSHPDRFRFWHSWLFNALEVALLGFQLFIDVRSDGTPSLVALASPLVLVATLVLCVQALRYRVELHIFTATFLIVVCASVTFYSPLLDTPWSASVIEEMRVLYSPPPNVMRIVILATLALVIGTAVYRSRRLVERVAKEVEDASNLRRFLPSELGSDLSDDALQELRVPQRKEVVVAMIDLRGFTELSDTLSANEVADILLWFRSMVLDAAERHNGVVDKFVGDGAMMIFGLHDDPTRASFNALAAFNHISDAVDKRNADRKKGDAEVAIAAGLHSGPTLVGAFGDDRRLEFTALGKTVNIASRLEAIAKENGMRLVASQAVLAESDAFAVSLHSLGPVTVRGIADPIQIVGLKK
ncbi:adenylate/guanylate cyclase domain-containing protein [uncultured Tateyamaria sp.]|uniref:adenylate/guanylate cyclase domain-containing protein n=4 Tax=uncultured Tateyamaria sp. TaxID=455651 RepID=UPI00261D84DB|nr:adenylate/guanylate cyclase domain-containing protein [uncultured Tateyamaria sp.]